MSVTVNLTLVLPDSVARDLTRLRRTQAVASTVLVGDIDSQATQITLGDINHVDLGTQLACVDTGELMTVTALPATAGAPLTVLRGDCGDTAIPAFPSAASAAHADQQQILVLKYGGLVDMGKAAAMGIIQGYIQQMDANSETMAAVLAAKAAAEQAAQNALNNVIAG